MIGDNLAPSSCETGVEDTPLGLGIDETDCPPADDGGQLERKQIYFSSPPLGLFYLRNRDGWQQVVLKYLTFHHLQL